MPFAATCNMNAPKVHLVKWSKVDRKRQIYDITCVWNSIKYETVVTYLQNGKWLTDTKNTLMVTKVASERGLIVCKTDK